MSAVQDLQERIAAGVPSSAYVGMTTPVCVLTLAGERHAVADIYDAAVPEWMEPVGGERAVLDVETGAVEIVPSAWWPGEEDMAEVPAVEPTRLV